MGRTPVRQEMPLDQPQRSWAARSARCIAWSGSSKPKVSRLSSVKQSAGRDPVRCWRIWCGLSTEISVSLPNLFLARPSDTCCGPLFAHRDLPSPGHRTARLPPGSPPPTTDGLRGRSRVFDPASLESRPESCPKGRVDLGRAGDGGLSVERDLAE